MIGIVFWQEDGGVMPKSADTAIKVAGSFGTVFGQLFFGHAADRYGRKMLYGIELLIIISATLAESVASPSPAISMVGILVFWRAIIGIGVGGDYPTSAVITAEMSETRWRGMMISAVFAMQGMTYFDVCFILANFRRTRSICCSAAGSGCYHGE